MIRTMMLVTALLLATKAYAAKQIDPNRFGLTDHEYAVLYCKNMGSGRKAVWMNTDRATYALNGQAIDWVQRTNSAGTPLVGYDGGPWKLGRDHFDLTTVHELIQLGLRECG